MIAFTVWKMHGWWRKEGPWGPRKGGGEGVLAIPFPSKRCIFLCVPPYSDFTLTPHDGIWRHILYQVSVTKNTEKS